MFLQFLSELLAMFALMFLQCATDIFAVGYNLIAVEHLSHLFIHSDNGSCDGEGEVKKRGCKHRTVKS